MMPTMALENVKALLFDVFGTVVDWRGSVIREIDEVSEDLDLELPSASIADDWRRRYGPSMDLVLEGREPYVNLDVLHRQSLEALLDERRISLPAESLDSLVLAWHRLEPWPDSIEGLARLKQRFVIATFSNGSIALLTDMAKHAGLPWDVILSPELVETYKRNLDSYRHAISLLGLESEEVMMVAAHDGELAAVSALGLRTAYVPRPTEHGGYDTSVLTTDVEVDVHATDLVDLAEQLRT